MNSLKKQTITGIFWSFLERFGTQIIVLITQIILARLLLPSDFGLIGMLAIFMAISQIFVDSGFGDALIQKKNPDQADFSTVFYINVSIGILFYVALFFSAPKIAAFFNQEKLIWLTRFIGVILIINSFGLIQFIKCKKDLNFKAIARVAIASNVLSAILGISLALLNFGVWALAAQMVSIYFFRTIFFWITSNWYPSLVFSYASFKRLFSFGSKLLLSGIIDQTFQNIYLLIIGKLFTANELGYYFQAKRLQEVPVITLATVVGSVTFPAFSKIQNDNEKLQIGFRKMIKLLVFINFPLMLGLAAIAEPLFLLVFGEKWMQAVPYFQMLCIAGMLYTLHTSNLSILQVKGRSDLFLYLEIVKKIIIVVAIIIGLQWGIFGLVIGQVVTSFLSYFLNAYYSGKLIGYSIKNQLKDITPTFIISLFMVFCMAIAGRVTGALPALILQILTGAGVYFLLSIATRQEAIIDSMLILKEYIPLPKWKKIRL